MFLFHLQMYQSEPYTYYIIIKKKNEMKNQVCIEVKAKTQLRLFDENKRRKVRYIKEGDAREVCFLLASSTGAA